MKSLSIVSEKCTGCRICEFWCSMEHENKVNPIRSRIRVLRQFEHYRCVPLVCHQCVNPPCVKICPEDVLYKDSNIGCIKLNEKNCTGCRLCLEACPYGAIVYGQKTGYPIICDLCQGDPICKKVCPEGVIHYTLIEFSDQSRKEWMVNNRQEEV